ncbi:MAG TPA: cyclic pyranopterin monophosphate synthase MoaC [Chloroflexia bacterium]|nr:cyclic pyranopterin monophosphate synthase MoaC [Chloroflexia bacterium]
MDDSAPHLTHLDAAGRAQMVDVGAKAPTARAAHARAEVWLLAPTLALIRTGQAPKGDVAAVARIAGIMAAKKTAELIPLCHPLALTSVQVALTLEEPAPGAARGRVVVEAHVQTTGPTGVEMEALTAVSVAALTVYDMIKAVDRGAHIDGIRLLAKSGGKSGPWQADEGGHDPR